MLQTCIDITKVETQADKGIKITLLTPELTSEQKTFLFNLQSERECIGLFESIGKATPTIDPNLNKPVEGKSKSQQLRAVLYRYWEQEWSGQTKFDDFYSSEMEKITSHYQSKLN